MLYFLLIASSPPAQHHRAETGSSSGHFFPLFRYLSTLMRFPSWLALPFILSGSDHSPSFPLSHFPPPEAAWRAGPAGIGRAVERRASAVPPSPCRRCSSVVGVASVAMPVATSPAAPAAQEALEIAGRIIDRQIQDDRCYPDLSELLAVPAPGE